MRISESPMTLNDFCEALAACADRITWDHGISMLRGYGRLAPGQKRVKCCPLTAVAYAKSGKPFSVGDPIQAARYLNLPMAEAMAVVCASDLGPLSDHEALAARLRACVGLPPEGASDAV